MMDWQLILAVLFGVFSLLSLILKLKIHPFLALLIASILVGLVAGLEPELIYKYLISGIGGTLGFVATIVGLGTIMGAILEKSGGASSLASWMIHKMGEKKAPWAMMLSGFLVSIPVFFDVAFIILLPMAIALQRKTKKSLLTYALPLLAGLAVTHAFIPPTPGPVAVADVLGADIGWVILFGAMVGIPTAVISGPLLSRFVTKRINIESESISDSGSIRQESKGFPLVVFLIILCPIALVVLQTFVTHGQFGELMPSSVKYVIAIIGHPFTALILANLLAWYYLGIRRGFLSSDLLDISSKSFRQSGAIILLTGAGGGFKQILIETGAGEMIAELMGATTLPPVLFCFLVAAIIRVLQGSSTVAMITAAGFTAPLLMFFEVNEMQKAILVISIASGATFLSHVNDSGFWLVQQYLGMNEKETFKSWTLMTVVIGCVGCLLCGVLMMVFSDS